MNYGTDIKAEVESIISTESFFKYNLKYRGRIYSDFRRECLIDIRKGDRVLCSRGYSIEGSMKLTIRRKL